MLAADIIAKWRVADPVSCRIASACCSIANSWNGTNGACGWLLRQAAVDDLDNLATRRSGTSPAPTISATARFPA